MNPTFQRLLITHPVTRATLRGTGNYALRQMRGVVMHWTANTQKGADALRNRNYFNNGAPDEKGRPRAASAHYVVDSKTIIQCLPETEVGFHCGDKPMGRYKPAGLALMKGYSGLTPNYFTLGVEMCVNSDGKWDMTYENSVALAAELLVKHGLRVESDLYRHFDITGKKCPDMMIDEHAWDAFRMAVALRVEILEKIGKPGIVTADDGLNVRSGPGARYKLLYTLGRGERVLNFGGGNGWVCIGTDRWVNASYLADANPFSV